MPTSEDTAAAEGAEGRQAVENLIREWFPDVSEGYVHELAAQVRAAARDADTVPGGEADGEDDGG